MNLYLTSTGLPHSLTWLEGLEVSSEDGGVDVEERLHGGKGHIEDTEQWDEPWIHLIPATTSLMREMNQQQNTSNCVKGE